jgi:6-phosphofructokinase 1
VYFDRFFAAQLGGKAVEMLTDGYNNHVSILQHTRDGGWKVEGFDANRFRDRWGHIHARNMHRSLFDPTLMRPSRLGIEYLQPIFTRALNDADAEHMLRTSFAPGNLTQPYHSPNTDVNKRIRYLD